MAGKRGRIKYPDGAQCWKYKTTASAVRVFAFYPALTKARLTGLNILMAFNAGNKKPHSKECGFVLVVTAAGFASRIPKRSALKILQTKKRSSKLGVFSF